MSISVDNALQRIANEALQSILPLHAMILVQGYDPIVEWLGRGTFGIVLGLVKHGRVVVAIKISKQGGTFQGIVNGDFGREAAAMMISSASRVPFALPRAVTLFGESAIAAVPTLPSELESEAPEQGQQYIAVAAMSAGSCTGHGHLEYVNSDFRDKTGQVSADGWAKCRAFYKSLLEATSSAHASGMAVRDMKPSNWILKEIVPSESGPLGPGRDTAVKTKDGIVSAVYLIDFGCSMFDSVRYVRRAEKRLGQALAGHGATKSRIASPRAVQAFQGGVQALQGKGAPLVTSAGPSSVGTPLDSIGQPLSHGQYTCVMQRDIREAFGLWTPTQTSTGKPYSRPLQIFREGGGTQHYNAPEHKCMPSNNHGTVSAQSLQPADMFAIGIALLDTLSSKGYVQMPRQEGRDEKLALARASDSDLWTKYLGKNSTSFARRSRDWQLALSLASSLISKEPEKRLTAHQALRHPFFSSK
jgi:hypothetical protein